MFRREAMTAGIRPHTHAHAAASIDSAAIMRQLTVISRPTMPANGCNARFGVSQKANSMPAIVPAATIATASSTSCRAISIRDAPSALRTASSRPRSIERTTSSPARLVNAMNMARPAAPASRLSVRAELPVIAAAMRVAMTRAGGVDVRLTSSRAALSEVGETFGARRAIARTRRPARAACAGDSGIGRQMSDTSSAKKNRSGITPTIVWVCPSSTSARPMTPGSPSSVRRQKSWLTIATGRPTSSALNPRPIIGAVPSSAKNPGVTSVARVRSAAPNPVKVRLVGSKASMDASDWARSRQASSVAEAIARDAPVGSSSGVSPIVTSASGSAKGGGVSSTASTTAKIDAPAPSVRARREDRGGSARWRAAKHADEMDEVDAHHASHRTPGPSKSFDLVAAAIRVGARSSDRCAMRVAPERDTPRTATASSSTDTAAIAGR